MHMHGGHDQTSRNAAQLPPNINHSPAPPPSVQEVCRARETNGDLRLKRNIAIFRIGIAEMVIGGLSLSLSIIPLILLDRKASDRAYPYTSRSSFDLSWELLIVGLHVIVLEIPSLILLLFENSNTDDLERVYTVIAPGFWGGMLTMIAGILGYGTKGDQSQSMYLANMIFASFLAMAASASCITAGLTVGVIIGGLSGVHAVHILISMLNAAAALVAVVHALLTWNKATSAVPPPASGHGFNLHTVPAVGYHYATDATPNLGSHANMSQTSTQPYVGVNNGQHLPPYSGLSEHPLLINKATIFRIGIAEIAIGGLSIILTIIPLAITGKSIEHFLQYSDDHIESDWDTFYLTHDRFAYASPGIWGGMFSIVTGILAVFVKSYHSRCMYIANMTLAIITACVVFTSCVISGFAAALSFYSSGLIAVHVIVSLLNFASMIIVIIHAARCCSGATHQNHPPANFVSAHTPHPSSGIYHSQPTYVQSMNDLPVMPQNVQAFNNGAHVRMAPTLMSQGPYANDHPSLVAQNNASATAVQTA